MVGEFLYIPTPHSISPKRFRLCESKAVASASSQIDCPRSAPSLSMTLVSHPPLAGHREPPPLSGGTKPEAKTPLQRQPLFGRRGLGRRGFSQRSRLLPRVSPPNRLFRREREGGGFSSEKSPPSQSQYYLLSYPSVRKSSMRLRQSGRTLTQSFRLTCRPRSFSMSARASLPIC